MKKKKKMIDMEKEWQAILEFENRIPQIIKEAKLAVPKKTIKKGEKRKNEFRKKSKNITTKKS